MVEWQTGYVQSGAVRIHYRRAGAGVPLIMVHGMTDNGACWQTWAEQFVTHYDVILVDARGHGQSDTPAQNYAPHDHAEDIREVIIQLDLDRSFLLGHSMGGMTVFICACLFPELLRGVILEDPAFEALGAPYNQSAEEAWMAGVYKSLDRARKQSIAQLVMQCIDENPTWQACELIPWAESKHQVGQRIPWIEPERHVSWTTMISQLGVPALLVVGGDTERVIVTGELATHVRMMSSLVEIALIRDVGHCIRRENPKAFAAVVWSFLSEK
ncbi:MAG: alpha/beta fold hydrolase [Roseiflexaceae bacterium]